MAVVERFNVVSLSLLKLHKKKIPVEPLASE